MLRRVLFAIVLIVLIFSLIDCKKDDVIEPDPSTPLVATWNCTKAMRGGVAQDGYDNFKLILSATDGASTYNYSCSGRPSLSPWPASGSWKFGSDEATDIIRDADFPMSYSVSGNNLEMTFNYSGAGFSRTTEVNGAWVFTFSK